jgi:hypothetical protein
MNDWGMWQIIIFVIAIAVHEAGHILVAVWRKTFKALKFHWYGIEVISEITWDTSLQDFWLCVWGGMLLGAFPALTFGSQWVVAGYVTLCCADIGAVINLWRLKQRFGWQARLKNFG